MNKSRSQTGVARDRPKDTTAALDDASLRLGQLYAAGRLDDTEALCREILEQKPDHFLAHHALGAVNSKRGEFANAERLIGQALKIDDKSPYAWNAHGSALRGLKRFDDALVSYRRAIALKPDFAQAFYNQAGVMLDLGRNDEALANFDRAIALEPKYVRALFNRAGALQSLGRMREALDAYDRVIAVDPSYADAFNGRGNVLTKLRRPEEALVSFDRAIELDPEHGQAGLLGMALASQLCVWDGRERRHNRIDRLLQSDKAVAPFPLLHDLDAPALHLTAAKSFWRLQPATQRCDLRDLRAGPDERIRVAYISADFCHHPVAYSVVELFELHDRTQFEIHAVSLTSSDDSPIRKRLEAAIDHFIDAERLTDQQVAAQLADLGVGIAVDLTGHTAGHRPGIFARRPAPITVNYLGYPGTSGGECIDYIVADPYVIPEQSRSLYSEKIAYLPHTYFVSDSKRPLGETTPSRSANHLPKNAFIFCSFNAAFKMTPELLTVWARILNRVENSILWLNVGNPTAQKNLYREIEARGVSATRLIFAPFISSTTEHFARLRNADLFLDAFPYNAHSTACDALYAGVPVITCSGSSFASRVAGSLLKAAGIPELITQSVQEYEALALKLANDPTLLRGIRERLAANRASYPLFDTDGMRRHIEAAYRTMWDRYRKGLPPAAFAVAP